MRRISLTFAVLFLIFGIIAGIGGQILGVNQKQIITMVVFNVIVSLLWIGVSISTADKNRAKL